MAIKSINIARWLVRPVLWASQFVKESTFQVVCKGYNEDYEMYTGLVWSEDSELNPYDAYIGLDGKRDYVYKDFQVWL